MSSRPSQIRLETDLQTKKVGVSVSGRLGKRDGMVRPLGLHAKLIANLPTDLSVYL
jgi:hypothetical protein